MLYLAKETRLSIKTLVTLSFLVPLMNTQSTFSDKTNTSLHCVLNNHVLWEQELTISPPKHVLTNVNTTSGTETRLLIYGSSVTLSCKDPIRTFNNKIVSLLGGSNLQYNIYRKISVSCSNSGELSPDVFNNMTSWCSAGCSAVQFGSGYLVRGSSNTPYLSSSPDTAPVLPGRYIVQCSAGHVTAWGDKGLNYTECENGEYTTPRDKLITCAPGCRDIAADIVPYIRGLYIDTAAGDARNMIWPGAPYPSGAAVTFSCLEGDVLVGERVITCNKGNSSRELGWFSSLAPTCQLRNSGRVNILNCCLSYLLSLFFVYFAI